MFSLGTVSIFLIPHKFLCCSTVPEPCWSWEVSVGKYVTVLDMETVTTKVKVDLLQVLILQETNQDVKTMVQREVQGEQLELGVTTLKQQLQTGWVDAAKM